MANSQIRQFANSAMQISAVVFALVFTASKLFTPIKVTANDLVHLHETYPNFNWVIAHRLQKMGFKPGDKIAMMGMSIDAEWARVAGLKIVGEVPILWDRNDELFRRVVVDRKELKSFWWAKPQIKNQVYDAFRRAGATAVFVDYLPGRANGIAGWQKVDPTISNTLPLEMGGQADYRRLSFKRLN